ncbi:MAG: hypothetical protein MRY77_07125, partial [Rhodobacteraceae bacterium]|nr:hypothetical protein [Paracoccaceae bacterium]
RRILLGATRISCLRLFRHPTPEALLPGPSGAPVSASAPPVKGVLCLTPNTRNPFFNIPTTFLMNFEKFKFFNALKSNHSTETVPFGE